MVTNEPEGWERRMESGGAAICKERVSRRWGRTAGRTDLKLSAACCELSSRFEGSVVGRQAWESLVELELLSALALPSSSLLILVLCSSLPGAILFFPTLHQ